MENPMKQSTDTIIGNDFYKKNKMKQKKPNNEKTESADNAPKGTIPRSQFLLHTEGFIYSQKRNSGFHPTDYFCILCLRDISNIRYSDVEQLWELIVAFSCSDS